MSSYVFPKSVGLWYKFCALYPPGFALCNQSQASGIEETNKIKTNPNVLGPIAAVTNHHKIRNLKQYKVAYVVLEVKSPKWVSLS